MTRWLYRRRDILILIALTALGLGLRLYQLGALPYGMHPDEGYNALDAVGVLRGVRPIFFEQNNGREPLFIYLIATSIALFGRSIWAVRLAGALAGTLMILAQYLLVRSLPFPPARLIALVSAALVATTFWPVHQSHVGLRAVLLPVWLALMLWAWWHTLEAGGADSAHRRPGWRSSLWLWAAVTGVFLALANYTYLLARALPLILLGSAVWQVWRARRWWPLAASGVSLATATVLLTPLALYFHDNPDMLFFRADQVSLLSPTVNKGDPLGALLRNGIDLLLAFNVRGTTWWYENLAGRPIFDAVVGAAFLVGVGLLAWRLIRPTTAAQSAAVLIALTAVVTLIPSWLSDGAPTYIRMTAVWPWAFFLAAWGLVCSAERIATFLDRSPGGAETRCSRYLTGGLIVAVLSVSAFLSYRDLFVVYAQAPGMLHGPRVTTAENGRIIGEMVADRPTYVTNALWVQPVIRFLNADHPPGVFDPNAGLVLPPEGDVQYAYDLVETRDAEAFGARWPQFERLDRYDRLGELSLISYRLARERWPALSGDFPYRDTAIFGDNVRLLGHRTSPQVKAGDTLSIDLEWEALAPTDLDDNFFVHLVASDGRTIGQYDGAPLRGSYLSNRWRPGERLLQTVSLRVARDAAIGPATLRVGWYDWRSGERLPIPGDNDSAVDIGQVQVLNK